MGKKKENFLSYLLIFLVALVWVGLTVWLVSSPDATYALSETSCQLSEAVWGSKICAMNLVSEPPGIGEGFELKLEQPRRFEGPEEWVEFTLRPDREAKVGGPPYPPVAYRLDIASSIGLPSSYLIFNDGNKLGHDYYYKAGNLILALESEWEGQCLRWHVVVYPLEGWDVVK